MVISSFGRLRCPQPPSSRMHLSRVLTGVAHPPSLVIAAVFVTLWEVWDLWLPGQESELLAGLIASSRSKLILATTQKARELGGHCLSQLYFNMLCLEIAPHSLVREKDSWFIRREKVQNRMWMTEGSPRHPASGVWIPVWCFKPPKCREKDGWSW